MPRLRVLAAIALLLALQGCHSLKQEPVAPDPFVQGDPGPCGQYLSLGHYLKSCYDKIGGVMNLRGVVLVIAIGSAAAISAQTSSIPKYEVLKQWQYGQEVLVKKGTKLEDATNLAVKLMRDNASAKLYQVNVFDSKKAKENYDLLASNPKTSDKMFERLGREYDRHLLVFYGRGSTPESVEFKVLDRKKGGLVVKPIPQ